MRELTPDDFADAVAGLLGRPLGETELFAVAVSGGPDSSALLLLAAAAFGRRLRTLTVDHRLRDASADEAADVARLCRTLGVPHVTLCWEGDRPAGNLQAAARDARYRLMGGWCAMNEVRWLATAHHADDQAETLLMRLSRGAGVAGLGGVRRRRPLADGVTLLRPLLSYRRVSLAKVVEAAAIMPADDPSNSDTRFDRSRARALLAATSWLDAARLAASADYLAEAEEALAWADEQAWRGRASRIDAGVTLDVAGLPRELSRRLVLRAIQHVQTNACPTGPEIDRLLMRLRAGGSSTVADVKARGGSSWRFEPAPPRRAARPSG